MDDDTVPHVSATFYQMLQDVGMILEADDPFRRLMVSFSSFYYVVTMSPDTQEMRIQKVSKPSAEIA